ncbi:HrcA family transcriptional regulator [Campylobacter sp. JMF_02 ED1]|uniref:HrcA family transcriptional regulator n=1 Tax=Campylobacter sp. JMF_02 ED1 TaxID=2983826 RepID=UPI0022E99AB7|nr:HrcA family transcriptional regulator [Campylobacter sp. JMF_02 ED1]MDA3051159.1 HrcA family transcriptional regulator [Campylobacter sp. JMF_02 ED1]
MKTNKRDLILDSIIEAYLDLNAPIGSSQLGGRMEVAIPASTIRVYFKKLSDEGAITQLHVSGGRIPTVATMQDYWRAKLDFSEILSLRGGDELEAILEDFDIYCMIFSAESECLTEVIKHDERFMILVFDKDEIILKFDSRIFELLSNLIGISLKDLEVASMQIGLRELNTKIRELKNSKIEFIANEVMAYKIFKDERFKILLNPSIAVNFDKNLIFAPYFEPGFMGIKCPVKFENKDATMICAGSVYEDYEKFFKFSKGVA